MIWISFPELDSTISTQGARFGLRFLGQAERHPQVVDRHHVTSEVDHSQEELRSAGHLGQRLHVEDFLDPHHFERITLSAQLKHDVGLRSLAVGVHTGVHHDIDHRPTLMIVPDRRPAFNPSSGPIRYPTAAHSAALFCFIKTQCRLHENRSKLSSSSRLTTTPPRGEVPELLGGCDGGGAAGPGWAGNAGGGAG